MEKYGFVYLWYDKKHKRFYLGCHWGDENDRYICSSVWMKRAYNIRSQDFKRRVLIRIYSNPQDLFEEEYKWLSLIKKEELGKKYYNLVNFKIGNGNNFGKTEEDRKAAKIKGYVAAKMRENCKENSKKGIEKFKELLQSDPIFREKFKQKLKNNPNYINQLNSEEAIKKKKETFKKISHQQGSKNSSFGTFWITDGISNKKWKNPLGNLPEMFYKGRTCN